jgi:hypothetical protein
VTPIGQQNQQEQAKLLVLGKKTVLKMLNLMLFEKLGSGMGSGALCEYAGVRAVVIHAYQKKAIWGFSVMRAWWSTPPGPSWRSSR